MTKPTTEEKPSTAPAGPAAPRRTNPTMLMLTGFLLLFVAMIYFTRPEKRSDLAFDAFLRFVESPETPIRSVQIRGNVAYGEFLEPVPDEPPRPNEKGEQETPVDPKTKQPKKLYKLFRVLLPKSQESLNQVVNTLREHRIPIEIGEDTDSSAVAMLWLAILLPVILFVVMLVTLRRTRDQLMGGGFLSGFSKSPAKRYEPAQQSVTFKDVAGLEGVKADLLEIVEFLKSPAKFQKLGGRIPKGVLLNGPPGTGKTLLARAVAGEAQVPFYSVNGSEFIQMFVGVGASRVRDLFSIAKESSPAIIFIDEIDAVGRQRGAGLGGGHDEREQTLNQILSEMDGFAQTDSVIIMAATNRPDVLDPALLRPGRFDRLITVGRPTQKGRIEIFKVHVRDVPLADDVDLARLAAGAIGLTGADIRNIVNEAALWAARHDKTQVDMSDFEYARDKVIIGAKREEVLSEEEKKRTAYHEGGHTLAAWFLPGADPVHKVTVIPRGRTLGATHTMPIEDRLNMSESQLFDQLIVLLAGRAAERLVFKESSVGAENDLERATRLARHMVAHWGMSEKVGPVSYKISDDDPFLGREMHQQRQFSERMMEQIDSEVTRILHTAAERAESLISGHRQALDTLVTELIRKEELDEKEISQLIGSSARVSQNGEREAV